MPDGYYMYYSEYGNFEFAVPGDWANSIENGEFIASNAETGALFRVSLTNTANGLDKMTQLDYVNAMSSGKSGYLLSSYCNNGSFLNAEARYENNGVEYTELHSILATNGFWYEFLFQCPSDGIDAVGARYLAVTKYFRVF